MLTVILGSAVFASLLICVASIYDQKRQKSAYFNLLSMAVAFYLLGNFLEFISLTEDSSVVGVKVAFLGMPFIPPLWYLCVREYCGLKSDNPFIISGLFIIPFATVFLAFTLESNQLLFVDLWYGADDSHLGQLHFSTGPLFRVIQVYLYLLTFLGIIDIITRWQKGSKKFREQTPLFLVSVLIPLSNTFNYEVKIDHSLMNVSSIVLSAVMVLFYFALRKYGIHNLSSIIKDNVINNMNDAVILFDDKAIYMDSNKKAQDIFPQMHDLQLGTSLAEMPYLPFDKDLLRQEHDPMQEFSCDHNGNVRTYVVSISHIQRKEKIIGYCATFNNITPIKNLMSELEIKANIDPLTGIFNRGFFFEKAAYEVNIALMTKNPLCVMMFDLDFFKKINDEHGHPGGDYVLKTCAQICTRHLRKYDVFGRYGGEEFCILLPDTDIKNAHSKACLLLDKIRSHPFEYEGKSFHVTASFGVVELDHQSENTSLEALLKCADVNLYSAKQGGRNQVIS